MLKLSAGLNSLDFCHDEQREALKRMEAISPGRWLDDIPPISAADSVQANRYSMLMDTDQKDPERRSLHNEKTKPDDHQTNPSVSRAHHHSLYSRTEQGVHRNRHRNSNSSLNPEKSDFGSDSLRRSHRTDSVSSSGSTSSGYRSPASLAVAEAYSGERLLPLATAIKVRRTCVQPRLCATGRWFFLRHFELNVKFFCESVWLMFSCLLVKAV